MSVLGAGWDAALASEFKKPYYKQLYTKIKSEYETRVVYPPSEEIFTAFSLTDLDDVKVLILGQDPYHEVGQAHGLSFSVKPGIQIPPSLQNIYKELKDEMGLYIPNNGYLTKWASQGVLMLNTVLTVRSHQAGSHRSHGWEQFTDAVIKLLAERQKPLVFILWGANAISKKELILEASRTSGIRHLIITAPHPSPLSAYRGFFGGRYFSRTNYFLEDNGMTPINWNLH